uniref:cellulase family glycosylhydrolase n=1 Tax=Mycolicibacterium palauense TaxID=2034511 RepID=UPI00159BBF44
PAASDAYKRPTLTTPTATATITNDDTASPGDLTLSIADATVVEGDGSTTGWLSTDGNQIVDSAGNPVELSGVNWFGFESEIYAPHGLWTRNYEDMMDQMVDLGFNTIRLPYSNEMLHTTSAPSGIDYSLNPDLQGLSPTEVMDAVIDYAGEIGMYVILDHHRSTAGAGVSENGLWYNNQYDEQRWIDDWVSLAARYADTPTVIGFDLHNEPYNGTWGGGGSTDWAAAAEDAGNAVLAVNPNLLVIVEGVAAYNNQYYWYGGNLMGVADRPIELDVDNQLVYSPHDYPNSVYPQPWFQAADFGEDLPDVFEQMWGYIYEQEIAPVYIGEFGTKLTDPKDLIWYEAITWYLSGDFDNNGTIDIPEGDEGISWTFWSWNPNSGDTGGILADDWDTVNENKLVYLEPIQFELDGSPGASVARFVVTLAQPSSAPVTVLYSTSSGTAAEGADYVGASGSITFDPGQTSKTVTVVVLADTLTEGAETFTVALSDPVGATIDDGSATGTILDGSVA